MLSYRHGYHAGNFADVLKHTVLCSVASYLQKKPGPLLFIDTHAGAGTYDLAHPFAQKTGEFEKGIARLWPPSADMPAFFDPWMKEVKKAQDTDRLTHYPGSPQFIKNLMRQQDKAALFELHSTEIKNLRSAHSRDDRVITARDDGLKGLRRLTPPRGPYASMRTLTLIDPSYEIKTEYEDVPDALCRAWRAHRQGVYILWYPVIDRDRVRGMLRRLKSAGIERLLQIEQGVLADGAARGMTAAGLLIINAPYTLEEEARAALPWLHKKLDASGAWLVKQLG